ncbi:alkaline phosphatase D family protein [Thalassotalea euphylliae]|uniref:alkaline phosphatase D family protein n=1 Tax=Thalassotalea euphylliae TaxID=1655234 RepID=UPI003636BFA9
MKYYYPLSVTALCTLVLLAIAPAKAEVSKIYFGSCAKQYKPMPIFDAINKDKPDVFVFLGDNIYGDTEDMSELQAKYDMLGAHKGFQQLRAQSEVVAIWDDHDFGENDAGKEYPQKEASRKIMLDFWQEPSDSKRYTQPGIYTSYWFGEGENQIHLILPDLRWNRDKLHEVGKFSYITSRIPKNMGPYKVSPNAGASMLGEEQWQWLEAELKKPAKLKIIGSSLQLLPEFTGWESWANFPEDRNRLLQLIEKEQIPGVLMISGDTHWGEMSKLNAGSYPLWEVTSSGLSEKWKDVSPNKHRVGDYTHDVNYGFIEVDWKKDDPSVSFGLKNVVGEVTHHQQLSLSALSF